MKCTFCNKTIEPHEKYDLFGCDGDFIHKDCIEKQLKEMDRVCNMTEEEFINWMLPEREDNKIRELVRGEYCVYCGQAIDWSKEE